MGKDAHYGLARLLGVVVFAAAALVLVAGGYGYYRFETERIRTEKYQEIAAIGKLKAGQIEQWRQERLGDVRRSSKAPFFGQAVQEWLREPTATALQAKLQKRLVIEQEEEGYADILLLDKQKRVLLSASTQPHQLSPTAEQVIEHALADSAALLSDLYRCPTGMVHMDAVAPILGADGQPIAVLVLRSDAESLLYPLVQSWPTPSRTAETLLVRRQGEEIVFLNDLRHRPNSALSLREALTLTDLPAVQAVLGKQGIFQGRDYRGVEVVADLRPIADSPWFLVAKVDASEILAEANYRGAIVVLFVALFILLAASVTAYRYRYRQAHLYQDLYQLERERRTAQEEFRATLYSIGDAVITTDTDGLVKQMNRAAESLTGWQEAEAMGKPVSEVFRIVNEETRSEVENPVARVLREGLIVGLANHTLLVAKDGSEHPIADSGAPICDESGVIIGVVLVFQDQTQERAAQKTLQQSEERFSKSFKNNPAWLAIVHMETSRVLEVNDAWTRIFGYTREESIGRTTVELGIYDAETYRKIMEEAKAKGSVRNVEVTVRIRTGENRVLLVSREVIGIGGEPYLLAMGLDITERKEAEEALRKGEERYRLLFDNMLEGVAQCKMLFEDGKPQDFIYLEVNDSFARLTGLKNVVGRKATEVIPGIRESNPELLNLYGKVARSGNPEKLETYVEPMGIWFSISVYSTEREHFIAVFDNITDRKGAEQALQESEERFRILADGAFEGVVISRDGLVLDSNEVFCKMSGYTLEELVGRNLQDIVTLEFRDIAMERVLSGSEEAYESAFLHKDGHVVPVQVKGKTIPYEGGTARIASIRNIQAVKKAEEVQKRLATAIEQAAEAVVITDAEGIIQYANPALERTSGFSRAELVEQTPRLLKSGEHDPTFYRHLWETIKAGNIWSGRFTNRRKDGRLYYEDATISPVKDASGKIVNFVAVKRDITEHLELSKQLMQAQKMEAVGTLAGGVAHDFNNILQVALGYSELILGDDGLPQRHKVDLQRIHEAARRGADLVQRLLTFSRKREVKPLPLNLNRRINDVRKMLERIVPKMIEIRLSLAEDLAAINADGTQIDQILMNIAVNARDAMPEGGRLVFETANVVLDEEYAASHLNTHPGHYALLTVTDTGAGMDKETLEHIFEPFYTTKETGQGTGLGLAMVYGIVQQHGAHIRCYSEPGQGTTFKIYFPALVSDDQVEESSARPMPRGGSESILLVDDEPMIRELCSRILTKSGYKVITASNGKEALEIYRAQSAKISLAILDLIMPEMGGKQCLKNLLRLDPSVKVVIASGYSADGHTKHTIAVGAGGFINKPYEIRQVLDVVRSVLDETPVLEDPPA